jgi:hypothetical protein
VAVVTQANFEKLLAEYYKDSWVKTILEQGLATDYEQTEWENWKKRNPPQAASPLDSYLESFSEVGSIVSSMVRNPFQVVGTISNYATYKFQ